MLSPMQQLANLTKVWIFPQDFIEFVINDLPVSEANLKVKNTGLCKWLYANISHCECDCVYVNKDELLCT